MLVMFTIKRRRIAERLATLILILSACYPAASAGAGYFTPGLQGLIDQRQERSLNDWQAALADLCTATIRAGHSGDRIIFKARSVTELLVHYDSSFGRLGDPWAARVAFRNKDLTYLVIRIPETGVQGFFERELRGLLAVPGVRLIGPRCLPMGRRADEEDAGPCVKPEKLAHAVLPQVEPTREMAECGSHTLDRNRKAIGLPELLSGTPGNTTLVSVIDVGFDEFQDLGAALATASYNNDGLLVPHVNGWDYCENDATIGGGLHGTQMSGLVGASCADFSNAPGTSQSGLIFGMQVFYEAAHGSPDFAGPEALAEAIHDAQTMGARVVNMSFTIHPESEDGWIPVKTALENAHNVVFVTGPWEPGELPYPSQLQTDNMILVGTRKWYDGELTAFTWGSDLHIDAPLTATLVKGPSFPGASNSIAMVSGAAAELLGRPNCDSMTPAQVRQVLIDHAAPSPDSYSKPLLQVGFLKNWDCD